VPNEYRDLALLVSDQHQNIHNAFELRAETIVKLFDKGDFWRKPQRLTELLLCCHGDIRGRTGFEQASYPQAEFLQHCYELASNVDVQSIISAGYQGSQIKNQLQLTRSETVNSYIKQRIEQ
jgi:tRNA nucleotidyltransferase (CCA-adding enzyme)